MQQKIALGGLTFSVGFTLAIWGSRSIHKAWFFFRALPEVLVPTPFKEKPHVSKKQSSGRGQFQ